MRSPSLGAVLLSAVLLVSGCGDSDPPPAQPAAAPTETPAESSAPPPTSEPPSPSSGPTSTYDGVAPATGPVIRGSISEVRAPEGWGKPLQDSQGGNTTDPNAEFGYTLLLSDIESPTPDESTDALVVFALDDRDPPPDRLDDVVIAGQPAFHVSGVDDIFGNYTDVFGLYYQGHQIEVEVGTPVDLAQAERDALIGTVLASFTLTG